MTTSQRAFKNRIFNHWTAAGEVFDVGIAARKAICRPSRAVRADLAGGFDEQENENGSLMRILPLLLISAISQLRSDFDTSSKFCRSPTTSASSAAPAPFRNTCAFNKWCYFRRLYSRWPIFQWK
ncbi:ADP-ribosylglycohydrolase family protein [Dyadobacter sp. SG02]|uniref:ADP-ribosylglycohydrolase family protein n=1 Tax=Dyadobacter sp. SG02 TaxID=1855291 RepID=UPI0038D3921D